MKKINKFFALFLLAASLGLSSCGKPSEEGPKNKVTSDTLYVNKVENMTDDFVLGMDSSSVLSLEESGVKYYDFDGQEKDLFKILAGVGVNHIRIRVWNDPWKHNDNGTKNGYGGGNVDIERAVIIGKRVTEAGMKVIIDFHYSDFWADPGRQTAPKAWTDFTFEQKLEAMSQYTKDSMQLLKDNNVDVHIVQIGNETNNGVAGIDNDENYENFSQFVTTGTRAVKEIYPEALTAIHFTDPQKKFYKSLAAKLNRQQCEYDIFGTSYYPHNHGTLENLQDQLDSIGRTYNKKIMVLETSYAYTDEDMDFCGNDFTSESSKPKYYPITPAGQVNSFRNICNMVANLREGHGMGVCYWEGTWIGVGGNNWNQNAVKWNQYGSGWAASHAAEYDEDVAKYASYGAGTVVDNQCFFDKTGHPLETLKVFGLMQEGNVTDKYFDGVVDETSVSFQSKENIVLPDKVNAIYNDDSRPEVDVTWDLTPYDGDPNNMKSMALVNYVTGTVTNGSKNYTTKLKVFITVSNYVDNGSFEEGDDGLWILTNNIAKDYQLKITDGDGNNPTDGKWTCHSYSAEGEINYEVRRNFTVDEDKNLNLRYYLCGGAKETPAQSIQNIYAYFLEDGEDMGVKINGYVESYIDHYEFKSDAPISFKAGKTYTIGFHVEVNAPGIFVDLDYINLYE